MSDTPRNRPSFLQTVKGGIEMTNEEKSRIIDLRAQGMGYRRICTELNLPENSVKSFMKRCDEKNVTGVCKECGMPVQSVPHKKKKLFCSDKCRNAWWSKNRDKRNLKVIYDFDCPICGKRFTAYANPHRVYCSLTCYNLGRRKSYGKEGL